MCLCHKKPSSLHIAVLDVCNVRARRQREAPYIGIKISLEEWAILHFHNLQCARLISAAEQLQFLADAASLKKEGRKVRRWEDVLLK